MSVKQALSRANPNTLPTWLQQLNIGQVLRGQIPQVLRKKDPIADPGVLATLEVVKVLADDCRAHLIHRATVRAGGVTGELAPQAYGATPATTQIAVAPNGQIVVLAADAITDVDVLYQPERGDSVTIDLPVVTNVLTIPAQYTTAPKAVVLLLDVTATVGTATGRKIVLVPGAGAPAAGQARLNIAKTTITFAGADAVTRATARVLVAAAEDLDTILETAEVSA